MPLASPLLRRAIGASAAIAALTAFCLAIILVRSRNASRQADNEMRLAFSAQAPVLHQAQEREQQRDRVLSKNLAQISKAERAAKKPADIAKRLPAAFPPLPHALSVSLSPGDSSSGAAEPPAIITVPREDLKPLFDRLEDCRACEEKLATAQQDLSDERTKVSALKIERDAAVKAARGGGFWSRFRTGLKWFAIGGAMGAFAALAVHR
ncbi:MAG: hypothetical protein DMG31_13660 [Acidobacteria bacterium]|nr:MAG: hypothetical protein DMG31_13660 [Acidobacteriota bacterium]